MTIHATTKVTGRTCGDCQLCCKLLPVPILGKPGGTRCKHQKFHVGCRIYAQRPVSCVVWSCLWLIGDDTGDMRRPDHAHYCVDCLPDFITLAMPSGSEKIPVIQVWIDPQHKNAHHDPALRAYLVRRAYEGFAALIRYNERDGFCLFAPPLTGDGQWHEEQSTMYEASHSFAEVYTALTERKP